MRLLLVTDHYPPFIGGAQRQSYLLARHMAAQGHEVNVVTPWHGGLPAREETEGIVVHRVRQLRTAIPALVRDRRQRHQPPFPDPVTVANLRRIIRETRPELVHAHGWVAYSAAAALAGQRIPLLLSARSYGYFCATRTMLHKGLPCTGPAPRKCLACASRDYGVLKGVVAVATVAAGRPLLVRKMTGLHGVGTYVHDVNFDYLGGDRMEADQQLVRATIPSVVDVGSSPDGTPIEAHLARLPKQPYILFVGAFRRPKGLEVLFEAYRRLESPPPLVLIGTFERDCPHPATFPPGTVVLTEVPHPAVMSAWDRALFGVMPSLWREPFGTVVAEGMSRGRPVIGTQIGGHADIIDEDSGILVPQGDVDALEQAMRGLIEDPDRREAMGRAARLRAQLFAAESVLPRFEQVYRDMLELEGVNSRS